MRKKEIEIDRSLVFRPARLVSSWPDTAAAADERDDCFRLLKFYWYGLC